MSGTGTARGGLGRRQPSLSAGAQPGDDWHDMIVMCAGTSWDGIWFPDKHMATRLTNTHPVLYVDPPMSILTPVKNPHLARSLLHPRLRMVAPRLARLTPLTPPGIGRPVLRDVAALATRRAIRRAVAVMGAEVRAVVSASLSDVFGACPAAEHVLYGTDDFASGGQLMKLSDGWLRKRERASLKAADLVLAVSPSLQDRWSAMGHRVHLLPNGCDSAAYRDAASQTRPADIRLSDPVAIFVGHLSERIDIALLEAVADTGLSLLLVGPRQQTFELRRLDALLSRPNVQWTGPKAFEDLPAYMGAATVGITPYADTPFNRSSFPLKTLEYLAAGLPAVVTALPSAQWLSTDLVDIASTPEEFAAKTREAACREIDDQAVGRRRRFAEEHSWEHRAQDFVKLLDRHAW